MIINLGKLPDDAEIREILEKTWWHRQEEDEQILDLDSTMEVAVKVRRSGNKFIIDGNMSGGILVRCDRCLEPYHRTVNSAFNLFLQGRPSADMGLTDVELFDDDMEVAFIAGEELSLDEIIREQIFLSLPIKCICAEGCLGLCPVCGGNLNRVDCGCRKKTGHPSFLKLKNLNLQDKRGK